MARVKCPSCRGTGFTLMKSIAGNGTVEKKKYCPKCKGTGYIVKKDRWSPR